MKNCFFIGHREASTEIFPALMAAVEQHIEAYGVTEFFVGNYGGFDHLAARTVIAAKERHPEINLSLLIPYHPAERPIEPPPGFDNTFTLREWRKYLADLPSSGLTATWSIMWII